MSARRRKVKCSLPLFFRQVAVNGGEDIQKTLLKNQLRKSSSAAQVAAKVPTDLVRSRSGQESAKQVEIYDPNQWRRRRKSTGMWSTVSNLAAEDTAENLDKKVGSDQPFPPRD